jgi:inner membrane protein
MPLPVAHGLLGASIVAALHQKSTRIQYLMSLVAGALLANAADLDFLLVAALGSKAWHRGFTHSIIFSLLICLLFIVVLGNRQFRSAMAYGLAFTSHGLLDYLTSKNGGGVELLWPLSTGKFILGWWGLSEVPSRLTRLEIVKALAVETALFSVLLLAILLLRRLLAKSMSSTADAI